MSPGARILSIAQLRLHAAYVEVMCFESARIYRLQRTHAGFAAALELLQHAAAARAFVLVRFHATHQDEIVQVERA